MDQATGFKAERLGVWSREYPFPIDRERIQAYAEATNDRLPPHISGNLAPPVFAVVPAFEALTAALTSILPNRELLTLALHGQHDFRYHLPITPGMTVVSRATALGFRNRSSGATTLIKATTQEQGSGAVLVEQYMTTFFRGVNSENAGESAPEHKLDEDLRQSAPVAELTQTFDEDQTFRYAAASGDPMLIHLDEKVARSVGLPGIIIHGLCTMAFNSVAVIGQACAGDPTRLKRLAVRFSRPVQPGQTITTRVWEAGEGRDTAATYAFETTADSGDVVTTDGRADVARAPNPRRRYQ